MIENNSVESEGNEMDQSEESATGGTYKCPLCDYSTGNSKNAKGHEKAHQANQEFKCNMCTYSTSIIFLFDRHMKKDHRNRQSAESNAETHEDNTEPTRSEPSEVLYIATSTTLLQDFNYFIII